MSTHVAYTNRCYRMAVKALHGKGITRYGTSDSSDHWIYPTAYCGTNKCYDSSNNTVSLVCDNLTGKFYRVGIPELWKDRLQTQYGGYDIPGQFKLKEHVAPAGEYEALNHEESHVHVRPYYETNRNLPGYNSDGFVDGFSIDLQMYEDGEPANPAAKIQQIPRYGDYVYHKRVEARRLQLEVLTTTSGWRCIKLQQQMQAIDKAAGPAVDYPSENQWQKEFSTPYFWITRNKVTPTMNRATGAVTGGTYDQLETGPDNVYRSGIAFGITDGLTDTSSSLTGDFTLSVWLHGILTYPATLWTIDTLTITLPDATHIRWSDGVNYIQRTIVGAASGWDMLTVERSGSNMLVFENGVQGTVQALANASIAYAGVIGFMKNTIITTFDGIILPRAVSQAALAYMYDDVLNNNGNSLLPINK